MIIRIVDQSYGPGIAACGSGWSLALETVPLVLHPFGLSRPVHHNDG